MYSETYVLGAVDGGVVGLINAGDLSNQHESYVYVRLATSSWLHGDGGWRGIPRLHINAKLRVGNLVQRAANENAKQLTNYMQFIEPLNKNQKP